MHVQRLHPGLCAISYMLHVNCIVARSLSHGLQWCRTHLLLRCLPKVVGVEAFSGRWHHLREHLIRHHAVHVDVALRSGRPRVTQHERRLVQALLCRWLRRLQLLLQPLGVRRVVAHEGQARL